ncbi:LysM peptidoglycan-binding domain-containing protein [Micromonospora aurantiaca]|uniref:LysM peptidoglycan-binding domain-containing protein n=1 Tax=Micromonospora aurantiaca (nom. illeg.) TaxID=47850 RepID=UPI001E374BE2|nr:LysM peptidoglycan-binding domain-containing protein [Micromonospora aurantiaca]UFN96754.1 LysM peptidoglycan-binding domain-containing protein [Micromonospora aurantiaca]
MIRPVRATVATVVFLAGVPALLVSLDGNPLRRWPSWTQVVAWFVQPNERFTSTVLTGAAVWAVWLLWAMLALLLIAELIALATRWRIPVLRLPAPLHRLVFGLAGTAAIAVTSVGQLNTGGVRPPAAIDAAEAVAVPQQALAQGPALIQVDNTRYLYTVERHDTLSKIAKQWLGDAGRWPEICRMNKHRHFPQAGGTLRDCDLIYPGWELRLPADAQPPQTAIPGRPRSPRPGTVAPSPPPSNPPEAPQPTDPPTPDIHETAATPRSSSPTTPTAPDSGSPTDAPTRPSSSPEADGAQRPQDANHQRGLQLTSAEWLPWSLAAAISAAAALVWRQRRRRYTGDPHDPPTDLPPSVAELRRAVARNPELPHPDDGAPLAALVPLPSGGVGLVGDGAAPAARATLVAALASGDPRHPDARGEVVIDAATLTTLLGTEMTTASSWPRLHITDTLDDALTTIETLLLHRSRLLDEQALTDPEKQQQPKAPEAEVLPPVVLITETPAAAAEARVEAVLAAGASRQVFGVLLGGWHPGVTIEVAPDGRTTLMSGQPTEPLPPRLPVLEPTTAIQTLTTLREAQTGEPPATTSPGVPATVIALHVSRNDAASQDQPAATATPSAAVVGKARLRVLGPPRIEDITKPGRPLRAKALELAVFLACHPDGVTTRDIGEYLEPDARLSQADQRVHTNASNLRHVLGRAGTAETKNAYVIKTAGRYRLDPTAVDVDVWTLRDLMRRATIATGLRRHELLTAACELYDAPLAEGQDYEWLQPHRETVRRWGTEAHLLLAEDLLEPDPQAASDLLNKAIVLDRYNEALYTKAMHARHALGDTDGIRTLSRALTRVLADLDAQPSEDTIALAVRLGADLTRG